MPASITFFGKPGCKTNRRQQALLRAAGYQLEPVDLLTHPWQRAELAGFFHGLPVSEWFNRAAPAVRDGDIAPEAMTADQALDALLREPLLIRRPLLEYGGRRCAGFDPERLREELAIHLSGREEPMEGCSRPGAAAVCP